MGCNVREKNSRTNRRLRLVRPDPNQSRNSNGNAPDRNALSNSISKSVIGHLNCQMGISNLAQNTNPNPNRSSSFEENGWGGFYTEGQMEETLLKSLELVCKEVISKLVSLGYNEDCALKAVLSNGYWGGDMDVMTNMLQNSLSYLENGYGEDHPEHTFSDLNELVECTLAGIVCLLQQVKPHLSREDAMLCLLISDLHVGRATAMEFPMLPPPDWDPCLCKVEGVVNGPPVGFPPSMYRFNCSPNECSSDARLQREIECPSRFGLSLPMKTLLKKNVASFAAVLRENSRHLHNQSPVCFGSLPNGDSPGLTETGSGEVLNSVNDDDAINSVLSKFRDLHIESLEPGNVKIDEKDEKILSLIHQIKDLERQVKERKEWAHQKAMQAARKLCNDVAELKMLRMEKEESQLLKKGKKSLEDTTMKKLGEMENALRKASGQVDRANSAVKKLENENAEIRAEMEAAKLSASESEKTFMEVTKREKKCLKKLSALEKQRSKLQDNIAAEINKISDLQKQLALVEAAQKEAEVKWRQEQKVKEQNVARVEEEKRLKEAAEANNKRKLEALRLKTEIDFQRHKDDLHRLEQELSRLKAPELTSPQHLRSRNSSMRNLNGVKSEEDVTRSLHELGIVENSVDVGYDRRCVICSRDEVSVLFLPCTHQVVCAKCNDSYGKKGKAACPCCRVPIQQRICVFGTTS